MDQTNVLGSLDAGRDTHQLGTDLYRLAMEALVRFSRLADPDRLPAEAALLLRQVFGPVAGMVILRKDGREVRQQIAERSFEMAASPLGHAIIVKAMESGHSVVDGQGNSKILAVPMSFEQTAAGAFVIEVAELERRHGNAYVDVARQLGRHFAILFGQAVQSQELSARSGGESEDLLNPTHSLREAKRRFERVLIRQRLQDNHGNIAAAARSLEMDRGQLSRLLKKYGVLKDTFKMPIKTPNGPRAARPLPLEPEGQELLERTAEA